MLESQLCTQEQFSSPWYLDWCGRMAGAAKLHRKQWEFCYIGQALSERGMLGEGRRGLGFGVGLEPLPALFATSGCTIVVTDVEQTVAEAAGWAETGQHAAGLESLNDRGICSAADFQRLVSYRTVNMNQIPADLRDFDFLWSACSLEHIGSLEHGKQFIYRAMECLRPGGIAVHTTEYNLSSDTDTFESEHLSLYRKRDIEDVVRTLRAAGHVVDVNFTDGTAPADQYVDLPPFLALPHLRLEIGGYITTSLGLIIGKGRKVYSGEVAGTVTGGQLAAPAAVPAPSGVAQEDGRGVPPERQRVNVDTARRILDDAYQRVLRRAPDGWAEEHLLPRVCDGLTRESLVAMLVDSEEFMIMQANVSHQLEALDGDFTIALKGCEPAFGPLRLQGPSRDSLVFRHIIWIGGIWEQHITNVLAHVLQPGDTFVDVGANLGYYAVIAGARVGSGGRVVAFEPQTSVRRYCETNVRLNQLRQVTVLPYALWDRPEEHQIWTPEHEFGGAFLIPEDKQEFADFPHETVRSVRLDDLLARGEVELPACHFIKLDIQGSEPFALRGMSGLIGRTRPILLLELHSGCLGLFNNHPRDLLQLVNDLGYETMLQPREGEADRFPDLVNVSPWPDVDIRSAPRMDRFADIIEELDCQYPPAYTADLIAFPREVDIHAGGLEGALARWREGEWASVRPASVQDGGNLGARVAAIHWFHQIDLGNDVVTPGADASALKLQWLHMPMDLRGKTVLDVGAWDGFFAFEAERRGARRVLATDSFVWQPGTPGSKEGFLLAREVLGSRVEDMEVDVMDLDPDVLGTFDLVLCLGVLYHMRDPLMALQRVARVTVDQLILETHIDALGDPRPMAAFYPGTELNNDATNWWGPNPAAVEGMLRAVGFRDVRMVWSSFDGIVGVGAEQRYHRAVFHAFK